MLVKTVAKYLNLPHMEACDDKAFAARRAQAYGIFADQGAGNSVADIDFLSEHETDDALILDKSQCAFPNALWLKGHMSC